MYKKKYRCLARAGHYFWFVVMALFTFSLTSIKAPAAEAICAEVKIVIEQKLSFERQAFDAKMIISNGLNDQVVEDVNIELLFMDANQQPVSATQEPNATDDKFFYRTDSLNGITSIEGNGQVASKTSAEIHWMIIPSANAVASHSTLYYIGAKVSYSINGQPTTLEVAPEYIIVKPLPKLTLDYFLPADVYADDPFTETVEPQEPFTLGVRITNSGFGDAVNTMIDSAQPKIVENKQNLLIGFNILGGYVADQPMGKSLLLDFGNIAAGTAKMGRWDMVTTLSGKFVEFNASFTHADELGGKLTSLLERVTTHILLHDVKVDLPGRDRVRDFLARDGDVLRVYESDGIDTVVVDRSTDARLVNANGQGTLSLPPSSGFIYAKLDDPYRGKAMPVDAVRADGKAIPAENIWLSKHFNDDLTWSHYINIFDVDTGGDYVFTWVQESTSSIAGRVYEDSNDNGLQEANEPGIGAIEVLLSGSDERGTQISSVAHTNSRGMFSFSGLKRGVYSLAVGAVEGMTDGIASVGDADGIADSGRIEAIQLGAGKHAQGYRFAKLRGSILPPIISKWLLSLDVDVESNAQGHTATAYGSLTPVPATSDSDATGEMVSVTAIETRLGDMINQQVYTDASGAYRAAFALTPGEWLFSAKAQRAQAEEVRVLLKNPDPTEWFVNARIVAGYKKASTQSNYGYYLQYNTGSVEVIAADLFDPAVTSIGTLAGYTKGSVKGFLFQIFNDKAGDSIKFLTNYPQAQLTVWVEGMSYSLGAYTGYSGNNNYYWENTPESARLQQTVFNAAAVGKPIEVLMQFSLPK